MPYKSSQQRKFFHTDTAKREGIKPSTVKEFDQTSKGLKLPKYSSNRFKKLKEKLRK